MNKFRREYNLQINFQSEYELITAISALELCVPKDDYNVLDPHVLHAVILGIWGGCFRDKEGSRPRIMPFRFEDDHEVEMWMEISSYLIEAGSYIQSYIEKVKEECNEQS